jgi:hypothetical protein
VSIQMRTALPTASQSEIQDGYWPSMRSETVGFSDACYFHAQGIHIYIHVITGRAPLVSWPIAQFRAIPFPRKRMQMHW